MTREEHLAWCKKRALEYVDRGDLVNAVASFGSDMRKHPETDSKTVAMLLAMEGTRCVTNNDAAGLRHHIEGYR